MVNELQNKYDKLLVKWKSEKDKADYLEHKMNEMNKVLSDLVQQLDMIDCRVF